MIAANTAYDASEFIRTAKKYGLKCKIKYPKETAKRGTDGYAGTTTTKYVSAPALCLDGQWAIPNRKLKQIGEMFPHALITLDDHSGRLHIWHLTYSYHLFLVHI